MIGEAGRERAGRGMARAAAHEERAPNKERGGCARWKCAPAAGSRREAA